MISCHYYFAPGFDGVAVGELAAADDGAVEVVGAEVEGGLNGGFAEHDPVGLMRWKMLTPAYAKSLRCAQDLNDERNPPYR